MKSELLSIDCSIQPMDEALAKMAATMKPGVVYLITRDRWLDIVNYRHVDRISARSIAVHVEVGDTVQARDLIQFPDTRHRI